MLFFQVALVMGYAYSHGINRRLTPSRQWLLHTVLLVLALWFLPIQPADQWKPIDGTMPTYRILVLLLACVGLPFFLLSTTGPLIQAWQSQSHPDRSPFRLFALSNAASLLALVSYPFVFERFLTLENQSWVWSLSFVLFALLAISSGWQYKSKAAPTRRFEQYVADDKNKPTALRIFLWLALPMVASVLLLATTNLMTQEIGSIPFLWILPLSLYLISFIICFDHERWYFRPFFYLLLFAAAIISGFVLEAGASAPLAAQIIGYSLACFGSAMCCHGELARIKPVPQYLTLFYLLISIGGALGGVFVALIAPHIFVNFYEFQGGLIAAIVLCVFTYGYYVRSDDLKRPVGAGRLAVYAVTLFFALLTIGFVGSSFGTVWIADHSEAIKSKSRNAYGTLTVKDRSYYRQLTNGRIEHGFQLMSDEWELAPVSYYGPTTGIGIALEFLRDQRLRETGTGDLKYGIIGLGIGTMCGWGEDGDYIRYYEINPTVEKVAREYFTYLSGIESEIDIVLGDARLQLERELANKDDVKFDLLAADAFSSDSIPIHLLTLESFEIYKQRLRDDGVLAVHISNRFLELANVVRTLADKLGMYSVIIEDEPGIEPALAPDGSETDLNEEDVYNDSTWVLVTNNKGLIESEMVQDLKSDWPDEKYTAFWTDDYASIVPLIHWSKDMDWLTDILKDKGWTSEEEEEE